MLLLLGQAAGMGAVSLSLGPPWDAASGGRVANSYVIVEEGTGTGRDSRAAGSYSRASSLSADLTLPKTT